MCYKRRHRSAFWSSGLRCLHEETLGPWLPTERTVSLLFCWCFTVLRHFSGHFGRSQLIYPPCSLASLLGSLQVLSAHSFTSNWQMPFLNPRKGQNDRRIIIVWPISTKKCCWTWGSNSRPFAYQANAHTTELPRPAGAQWRHWSYWAHAQANLSLRWAQLVILLVLSCATSHIF